MKTKKARHLAGLFRSLDFEDRFRTIANTHGGNSQALVRVDENSAEVDFGAKLLSLTKRRNRGVCWDAPYFRYLERVVLLSYWRNSFRTPEIRSGCFCLQSQTQSAILRSCSSYYAGCFYCEKSVPVPRRSILLFSKHSKTFQSFISAYHYYQQNNKKQSVFKEFT